MCVFSFSEKHVAVLKGMYITLGMQEWVGTHNVKHNGFP